MAAGLATLRLLDEQAYARLAALTEQLAEGLREAAARAGASGREQNVGRPDVAVNQPGGMRRLQARRDLRDDIHRPPGGQRACGQHVRQGRPVDQLHDQVGLPIIGLAVVVDTCDVFVGQGSCVAGLGLEPGQSLGVAGVASVQQLDGYRTGQDGIRGPPDLAVTSGADGLIKDITTVEERRGKGHQRLVPPPPDT